MFPLWLAIVIIFFGLAIDCENWHFILLLQFVTIIFLVLIFSFTIVIM